MSSPVGKACEALSFLSKSWGFGAKAGLCPTAPDPDARVSLPFCLFCLWEAASLLNFCSEIIYTLWVSQEHPRNRPWEQSDPVWTSAGLLVSSVTWGKFLYLLTLVF